MIEPDKRKAVYLLHLEGMGIRRIARSLKINRKTVRAIIEQEGEIPDLSREDKIALDPERLAELFQKCDGYRQRVYELLLEEIGESQIPAYSTLTRFLREHGIGVKGGSRCDGQPDEPGAEMQHDTTVYTLKLNGVPTKVVASLIYLRYSKRRYLRFYRFFNRFRMKCFLHEALTFWGYVAAICIIDNTSLARLRGTGKNAIIVSEMERFAKQYDFEFRCHELGHANRKAGNERSFWTVETNFLPGREFESMEDLNEQAFRWATEIMYHRPLTKARIIPAKAFEHERGYLRKLSSYIPAPYRLHKRGTNQYGYISFGGNLYWIPGESRPEVTVLEYSQSITLYQGRTLLLEYPLPPHGVSNQRFSPEGMPKPRYRRSGKRKPTAQEEERLRALGDVVGQYLDAFVMPTGIKRHNMIRKLFALSRKMTVALFLKSIGRALKYRVEDIATIQRIALLYVNESTDSLPQVEVDNSFRHREAYKEGSLTDEPDLSVYDDKEENHG